MHGDNRTKEGWKFRIRSFILEKKKERISILFLWGVRGLCQGQQTIESPQIKFNDENGVKRARSGISGEGEEGFKQLVKNRSRI